MQKRPKLPTSFYHLELDPELSCSVSPLFAQKDREITYLHFHDWHELGVCLEGAGVFMIDGRVMPFRGGDCVFIAAGERHLAKSVNNTVSRWHWLYFDFDKLLMPSFHDSAFCDLSVFSGERFANVVSNRENPEICEIVRSMVDVWQGSSRWKRNELLALAALFSARMRDAFPSCVAAASVKPDRDALIRLDKAFSVMARDYGAEIDLAVLPKLCGLSATHFRRLFRQAAGKSPVQYLASLRLSMAMAGLASSKRPVSELALACGFQTLSSFNRLFKRETGVSPRAWRAARQAN